MEERTVVSEYAVDLMETWINGNRTDAVRALHEGGAGLTAEFFLVMMRVTVPGWREDLASITRQLQELDLQGARPPF